MKESLSKLSGYDWLGYSFSGAFFLIVLGFLIGIHQGDSLLYIKLLVSISIGEGLIFLIFSYFTGHIIQGIFLMFEKTLPKNRDSELEKFSKDQLETVKKDFDLPKSSPKRIISAYRYLSSLNGNLEGHINQFNMLHYFFKGIFSTCFFITVITLFLIISNYICHRAVKYDYFVFVFLFFLFFSIIFYYRMNKFYDYLSEKICVAYELKKKDK